MVKPVGKRTRSTAQGPRRKAHGARTSRPADDAEQRILDAAHAVFVRAGTAGARTQEIAREAGVNSALLHYYFRSLERK
jgi:AcrR family transcriptional regulator